MGIYESLIRENVAPKGTQQIVVYNAEGAQVGVISLGTLKLPETGNKLYSFGAISDVHIVYDTAKDDFRRALRYFKNNQDVDFVCISGDLTDKGTESELTQYTDIITEVQMNKPIYAVAGNHEHYRTTSNSYLSKYTGYDLCYTVDIGNDVFIMVGIASGSKDTKDKEEIFYEGTLQWLYETLEANRNKRCFLFEHILYAGGCGDVLALYPYSKIGQESEGKEFKNLLKHYKNVIFFHGHSHMKFSLQEYGMTANYDNALGIHSIHIPSLAVPRDDPDGDGVYDTMYQESEGYVVNVYENGIYLQGRDFKNENFLPIASYWLDTPLQPIEANTYTPLTTLVTKK